jgi:hypothetical protein
MGPEKLNIHVVPACINVAQEGVPSDQEEMRLIITIYLHIL